MRFSERMGFRPVRDVFQTEGMDDALRASLWNALFEQHFIHYDYSRVREMRGHYRQAAALWTLFFKEPVDGLPMFSKDVAELVKAWFFKVEWFDAYDLIEFVATCEAFQPSEQFIQRCNIVLEREKAGYRFVKKVLAPITSPPEIEAIEDAQTSSDEFRYAAEHINAALIHISSRDKPDYRNSIKESICAVEAAYRVVSGSSKATLGEALKRLESGGIKMHPALKQAFSSLYGYTSDASGIRHALLEDANLDSDDARFMLVACSAFVNYLKSKSS